MKSAEETLREQLSVAFKTEITDEAWNKMKEGLEGYQGVINAIIEYGKQIVDKCAESAECESEAIVDMGLENVEASINKDSILNVKNLLT